MSDVKNAMTAIIARQPEDSTYEEILRELAYSRMIQRGIDDADVGRTSTDEEIKRKIESWRN
jgi:predicted transcriptional regulator